MNLPSLIQEIYGITTFTGLYSFEFVDDRRRTITEIFFMIPPKTKTINEPTRSSTIPTLGSNYNLDAGNGTKQITLAGDLFFPYRGSSSNPVATWSDNLENTVNGLEEFLSLRWFLIRYRDYTMKKTGKITHPGTLNFPTANFAALYKKIESNLNSKIGALYDKVELIFHDYDMADHWFCRVENFSSSQTDAKYLAISYTIELECYEPNSKTMTVPETKKSTNESVNQITTLLNNIDYNNKLDNIQSDISYNSEFISALVDIGDTIELIEIENENIQSGRTTALTNLPYYSETLITQSKIGIDNFITFFLPNEQIEEYYNNEITLDQYLSIELVNFYNVLQKTYLYGKALNGIINTIIKQDELRFYSNADNYVLTEEQFEGDESIKIENNSTFYYYTVLEGDNSRIIALRELKDQDSFVKILQINNITENDFINRTLIGQKIKIPAINETLSASETNLVYETDTSNSEIFLHGRDIATGIEDELILSGKGDLLSKEGVENTISAIEKRISKRKGSLNIFHPDWGTISLGDGNSPVLVRIERFLNSVLEQIEVDPRTEQVNFDFKKFEFKGETISIPTKVSFIGSERTEEVIANG